jgi:hypothetical protein
VVTVSYDESSSDEAISTYLATQDVLVRARPHFNDYNHLVNHQSHQTFHRTGACVKRPNLCIVTEFVKNGSLRDILANNSVKLAWA